jgi:S1-C subfamily serine protease
LQSIRWTSKLFVAGALILSLSGVALSAVRNGSPAIPFGGAASSDQARIVASVARARPSVVAIDVAFDGTDPMSGDGGGAAGRASGSGFVYSSDGSIVTNAHVVSAPAGASVRSIEVSFANGDRVPAQLYSLDRATDLAVLKVDGYAKLPPALELGDSSAVRAGQWAIAIGEPLELRQSVTVGVVSAFDRSEAIGDGSDGSARRFSGLLQTSAPINPGNSGGPLIDMSGRVIGINQAVAGGAQGIGFAIPIDAVKAKVAMLMSHPDGAPDVAAATPPDGEQSAPGLEGPSEEPGAEGS